MEFENLVNGEQRDELIALTSIFDTDALHLNTEIAEKVDYTSITTSSTSIVSATTSMSTSSDIDDSVSVAGDFSASVQLPLRTVSVLEKDSASRILLHYLPPIALGFEFPEDYPTSSPPKYRLACKWLNRFHLSKLCKQLDNLWEENPRVPILYNWIYFLQQDSLSYLGIADSLDLQVYSDPKYQPDADSALDERTTQEVDSLVLLVRSLQEYDKLQKQLEFEKEIYTCAVCFTEKQGSDCIQFQMCLHTYCKECMIGHFTVKIKEGDVKGLRCPDPSCDSEAHPLQVKSLLSDELYERYERLMLQSTLDTMLDITSCPRPQCETPVLLDPDTTMGQCTKCSFAFCKHCKMSYHGIAPCNVKKVQLANKLNGASEEDIEAFKERYGREFVEVLIREVASYEWMTDNCTPCPSCRVNITKHDGCNKMTCTRCGLYFCWICHAALCRSNPYAHFKSGKCALFPGQNDNEFDDVIADNAQLLVEFLDD